MKRIIFVYLGILIMLPCVADNKIERVSASYEYISDNPNESAAQAENTAKERAKQKALEDKFGVDVTKLSSTVVSNQNKGEESSTQINTFSLGGSSLQGEWIETIKEEVDTKYTNGFWVVNVYVEGRARKKSFEKADIKFAFVKDIQDVESPTAFRDGSDIYLRFSSPVAGYLCVYLIDEEQNAFCLLPYPHQQTGRQPIEANKEYIFFSERYEKNAQEYTLGCKGSVGQNTLYVIFSPNDFTKAADREGGRNFRNERLPRNLTYKSFINWLNNNIARDGKMVVRNEIINIRK